VNYQNVNQEVLVLIQVKLRATHNNVKDIPVTMAPGSMVFWIPVVATVLSHQFVVMVVVKPVKLVSIARQIVWLVPPIGAKDPVIEMVVPTQVPIALQLVRPSVMV